VNEILFFPALVIDDAETPIKFVRENPVMSLEEAHFRLARIQRCAPGSGIAARWSRARRPISSSMISIT
jgi:hypothetical protein